MSTATATATAAPTSITKPEPSPDRLRANRKNALLSTGPRTVEGKMQSRENAFNGSSLGGTGWIYM